MKGLTNRRSVLGLVVTATGGLAGCLNSGRDEGTTTESADTNENEEINDESDLAEEYKTADLAAIEEEPGSYGRVAVESYLENLGNHNWDTEPVSGETSTYRLHENEDGSGVSVVSAFPYDNLKTVVGYEPAEDEITPGDWTIQGIVHEHSGGSVEGADLNEDYFIEIENAYNR